MLVHMTEGIDNLMHTNNTNKATNPNSFHEAFSETGIVLERY